MCFLNGVKCTANKRGKYNQNVMRECPIRPKTIKRGEITSYVCQECNAVFKEGKSRQYPAQIPNEG